MYVQKGREVSHIYTYPGEYVVSVHAAYARHEQTARKTITVLPVKFSMTQNLRGDLQLHNDARYEVDISGYTLHGGDIFTFPPRTILLPSATITIPKERIGTPARSQFQLQDLERTLVSAYSTEVKQETLPEKRPTTVTFAPKKLVATEAVQNDFVFAANEISEEKQESIPPTKNTPAASVVEAGEMLPRSSLPYIGLAGVLILGIFAVYASGAKKHN
jgi:hypothetical protein